MNLNSHSTNETVIYNSYDAPLTGAPLGVPNPRPDFQPIPQTNYAQPGNYFQLSSNERFEFLKSIGVTFPSTTYSVNNLVNSPVLGHHYLSDPSQNTQVKTEPAAYSEQGEEPTGEEGRGLSEGYSGHPYNNESKELTRMYQPLDEYSLKQLDGSFPETASQNNNNRSLAQKLVLAKINGSKYSGSVPESRRGRGGARAKRGRGKAVEYRVVKKENAADSGGEKMVVEPEYLARTSGLSGEFDRSQFEKTFANYSMITTAGPGALSRGRKSLSSADPLSDTPGRTPVKKFTCDQCPKSFTLKQNLTYHVNSIHLGVRIKCVECEKSFAHKPNLIAHMQSAHNGVRFKCDHCVKSFNQKPNLISHIKSVHEGIKYKCEECTKTFAQKQNLLSHVQAIHMGIKYTCEVCTKSYNQVSNLLSHMTTVHQAQKHKCADCGRLFSQEHTLRAHIASVHMDIVYEMGGPTRSREPRHVRTEEEDDDEEKAERIEEEDDDEEDEEEFEESM